MNEPPLQPPAAPDAATDSTAPTSPTGPTGPLPLPAQTIWSPFDFDFLLIHQRVLTLTDEYDVLDAQGTPMFRVRRMLRAGRLILAGIGRAFVSILGLIVAFWLVFHHALLLGIVVLWASGPLAELAFLTLAPFRHIHLFFGSAETPILSVSQDTKIPLIRRFTLFDDLGQPVAQFEKFGWTNLYRRSWRVFTPTGELICEIREDTWARSIARRIVGPLFGLLRTDFYFHDPAGVYLGAYRRRLTLLDRYLLDLRDDPWRRLDRRVALAAGILLDTGERR